MSRPLTTLSLAVVVTAAAALVVVPAVEGADAQSMPAEPGMIIVSDAYGGKALYPNGTFAFGHWLGTYVPTYRGLVDVGYDGRIVSSWPGAHVVQVFPVNEKVGQRPRVCGTISGTMSGTMSA